VRICVIFNPAARGDKARHFRRHLDEIGGKSVLKATGGPGDARRLAAEAVIENFDVVVAAGGDGTVNEVLNGMADAPDGFAKARFAVLPLGTVNVFARELKVPFRVEKAWDIIQRGHELKIDLPCAEFTVDGIRKKIYFAQLAGAGLDARAIELVDFSVKKKIGPLAYVVAGLKALRERKPMVHVRANGEVFSGELILIGNGRLYGGNYEIFPGAQLSDGLLDACVFSKTNWLTLFRCIPNLLAFGALPKRGVRHVRAATIELSSDTPAAFELDGEWIGHVPVTFSLEREKLRVIVP
jgi:diacylglycerol kinase (ATP)